MIKVGDKVQIVKVIPNKNNKHYTDTKTKCIGMEGIVYGIPHKYYPGTPTGLPIGQKIYSVRSENGKDISPYAWFRDELKKIN